MKAMRLLNSLLVGDLLGLGGLRGQDHVGDIGHQRVALGRALELLHLLAHVLLGHREVAFPDLDAGDLGDHLVALRLLRLEPGPAPPIQAETSMAASRPNALARRADPRLTICLVMTILAMFCPPEGKRRRLVAQSVRLGNERTAPKF